MRKSLTAVIPIAVFIVILTACPRLAPKHGIRNDTRGEDLQGYVNAELDPGRDAWQKPDEVIDALRIESGQTVADIGAGAGYFTPRLAQAVGPQGMVYATETQADLVLLLIKKTTEAGLANVKVIKSLPQDPQLPFGSVDLALVCNNMSRTDYVYAFFDFLRHGMKPKGRVAVIDWKMDSKMGPPKEFRRSANEVKGVMEGLGFRMIKEYDFLKHQYFMVFMLEERYG